MRSLVWGCSSPLSPTSGRQPGSEDGPDQFDQMDIAVQGLTLHQFEQMHLSGVLRDGVTLIEIYLEKALAEVITSQPGSPVVLGADSPRWGPMRAGLAAHQPD